jgi:predicted amidohydrolase
MLLCSAQLAMAIQRRNATENGITVNVGSTGGLQQNIAGSRYASSFIAPDGRIIPIKVDNTIPANVLYGLNTKDLVLFSRGDFDFLREYGDIWEPSRGDRKTNYEAPYGGYMQFAAERCDNCFVIQDMRTDI